MVGPIGVYPRERGEAFRRHVPLISDEGLSPRTRGSRGELVGRHLVRGSIPANAGKPSAAGTPRDHGRVYPRERGEARICARATAGGSGLSPRTRGSPQAHRERNPLPGSIPANAGKPPSLAWLTTMPRVYPRERGEADYLDNLPWTDRGLSPRTRGSRQPRAVVERVQGSIPANAGKPSQPLARHRRPWVYPRERGEARRTTGTAAPGWGLSPRTRGSRAAERAGVWASGSIPANAGKPFRSGRPAPAPRVYPRERGEAARCEPEPTLLQGLSPRTRGSRTPRPHGEIAPGSIPANAGKPGSASARPTAPRSIPANAGKPW